MTTISELRIKIDTLQDLLVYVQRVLGGHVMYHHDDRASARNRIATKLHDQLGSAACGAAAKGKGADMMTVFSAGKIKPGKAGARDFWGEPPKEIVDVDGLLLTRRPLSPM